MDWYALFVKTGKEDLVQQWLRIYFNESILSTIIPQRRLMERKGGKVKQVLKKMFPGYIFFHTEMNMETYYMVQKIPDVIRILKTGEYYTKIAEDEMVCILKLLDHEGVVDYSKIYIFNSKIFIKSGPLKGMEGLIIAVDKRKNRVKVLVNFMGVPKPIDLGIEVLRS